ncbi:hypothetical protein AeNC1_015334, partial [Aphanomyces euteiches]
MRDLTDAYVGKSLQLRPSFRTVLDYIAAQDVDESEKFWRSYLKDAMPTVIGANSKLHDNVENTSIKMTAPLSLGQMTQAAQLTGVTVAEFAKLAWATTLRKFTRSNDILFGQVISNRNIPVKDAESIVGALITTVPFRVKFDDEIPLDLLMTSLQSTQAAVLPFTNTSLIDIKRWVNSGVELYDTLFAFQNMPPVDIEDGFDLTSTQVNPMQNRHHAIVVELQPTNDTLGITAHINPSRIDMDFALLILTEFTTSISQLHTALTTLPSTSFDLWQLSPAQCASIDKLSFGPVVPLPYELLHHAFEERAAAKPDLLDVEFEGARITYGELNDQAATLAHELVSLGVGVGSRVAVVMERCLEFPIG